MTPASGPQVHVAATAQEAADDCARDVLNSLSEALNQRGRAVIALSGGNTPKLLFSALAEAKFDWQFVHFFWVDERCVPPTDGQSNFKLSNDFLFKPAGISGETIHRIHGETPAVEAAQEYIDEIKSFFELAPGEMPVFDVIHRGMGPDAHSASLFPGDPLIQNRGDIAAQVWVEKLKSRRVTLLPGVLLAARHTVLQVSGFDKADALHHVLKNPENLLEFPCQIASRDSRAAWFVDEAAAARL